MNRLGIAPSKAKLLILGVAYKKDLADWRESPSIHVINRLLANGVQITYHDPFVPEISVNGIKLYSTPLDNEILENQDLIVITTDHSSINYVEVVNQAVAVLDTRGVTRKLDCGKEKVILL